MFVIPAKAGIQVLKHMDPSLRWDDTKKFRDVYKRQRQAQDERV